MTTTLVHGVTLHSTTEGSIIQSLSIEEKCEESNTSGMVSGVTQIVRSKTHSTADAFSVVGRGDLTLATGAGASNLSPLTGGVTNILTFKYEQKLGQDSEWTYGGNHYAHAA